jgi:hypothetical protein
MPRPWTRLEHSLALLDGYLHRLLGAESFGALKDILGDVPEGPDADGRSSMAHRLIALRPSLSQADVEAYDDHIKRHLERINAARPADERITLKYFQYLALFYTEHVLQRVFLERKAFLLDLNACLPAFTAARRAEQEPFPPFTVDDLTKLAYWMATGSGKTLLLHVNYYQFLHYHAQAHARPLDNILLITPNAGLSAQHLDEFARSGIPAQRFRGSGGGGLNPHTVQVLEITKLSEKGSGPLTVHVDSFEGNNLVFVDEGHRGASGDVWLGLRDKLAAEGFTFEYSATFGEALNKGNKAEDVAQRQSYGKAIVFDYSYRYFYGDGYGKEYNILNLPQGYDVAYGDVLLMGNLLAFYEQAWLYAESGEAVRPYQIEPPLLVFVGHTVQTGKRESQLNAEDKASLSDVLDMVRFLGRVVTNTGGWAVETIARILERRSDLKDEQGRDIFADKLTSLRLGGLSPRAIYDDMLRRIFHAPAPATLHLANLQDAPGELGLRVGSGETYFAVINIGDDANFVKLARQGLPELAVESEALRGSLFSTINAPASQVNLLIGAKKFTEGWNSWRVSGMGLLNVGRSEGSEIVQMFGRGVRLKGLDRSLKRSTALPGSHPPHIGALETLNIFSINGDYLRDFKRALEREGIADYEELELPLQYSLFDDEQPKLYTMRVKPGFQFASAPGFPLEPVEDNAIVPVIDLRPHIQAVSSQADEVAVQAESPPVYLDEVALQLLDWEAIYAEMLAWKRQRGFHNLLFSRDALRAILAEGRYVLYAPATTVRPAFFGALPRLEAIALAILKKYAERFYTQARKREEVRHLEYWPLDKWHENMRPVVLADGRPGYIVKVNRRKPDLVEAVAELIREGERLYREDLEKLPNVYFDRHLYQPLLSAGLFDGDTFKLVQDIKTVPTGLNRGEVRFPFRLRAFLKARPAHLGERRLYLLRNQSRGKGIGFFEADNFYPDFIVWVVDEVRQRIVFVDPKGLAMLKPNDFSHPKIQLYRTLQDIAAQLGNPDVSLDSYILSDQAFARTRLLFGTGRHTRDEFNQHHILFPEDANLATAIIG